jgi:voltage-gated potassium channel
VHTNLTADGAGASRSSRAADAFVRFERATDLPLALLALAIVPALVLEERATSPAVREIASGVNWVVWIAFCAEFVGKLWLAPSRRVYVRGAWFDVAIIALSAPFLVPSSMQNLRAVRVLRLLRIVRAVAVTAIGLREASQALKHRRFYLVVVITAAVVTMGALGIFAVDRGQNNNIKSLGDAFWWAVVTTTTVGYGDVSPVTVEGRLLATGLMVVGIGFIGVFTATLTSFFLQPEAQPENDLSQRLNRIEEQLATISEQLQRRQ